MLLGITNTPPACWVCPVTLDELLATGVIEMTTKETKSRKPRVVPQAASPSQQLGVCKLVIEVLDPAPNGHCLDEERALRPSQPTTTHKKPRGPKASATHNKNTTDYKNASKPCTSTNSTDASRTTSTTKKQRSGAKTKHPNSPHPSTPAAHHRVPSSHRRHPNHQRPLHVLRQPPKPHKKSTPPRHHQNRNVAKRRVPDNPKNTIRTTRTLEPGK